MLVVHLRRCSRQTKFLELNRLLLMEFKTCYPRSFHMLHLSVADYFLEWGFDSPFRMKQLCLSEVLDSHRSLELLKPEDVSRLVKA